MWTLTIICVIGMIIFLSFSTTIIASYPQISLWLRLGVAFTIIPTIMGIMVTVIAVASLDEERKKHKTEKIEYEPITYTVYKKK